MQTLIRETKPQHWSQIKLNSLSNNPYLQTLSATDSRTHHQSKLSSSDQTSAAGSDNTDTIRSWHMCGATFGVVVSWNQGPTGLVSTALLQKLFWDSHSREKEKKGGCLSTAFFISFYFFISLNNHWSCYRWKTDFCRCETFTGNMLALWFISALKTIAMIRLDIFLMRKAGSYFIPEEEDLLV